MKFSLLDLCPVIEEGNPSISLQNSLDLAQHAERWGYQRYWVAEHHNFAGIASSATSILIAYLAGGTQHIRVGAGGIMLPNHAPLVIAEQFGTLASLYPGRIDLGLGRAPGTDQSTAAALRRTLGSDPEGFPRDVLELMRYLDDPTPGQRVRAIPGEGTKVPIWILGSSLFGAQLAASLGLPYAFASHFAPADLIPAIEVYRRLFKPSEYLDKPHLMLGFTVMAAETDEEGALLATSMQKSMVKLRTGQPGKLPKPDPEFLYGLGNTEQDMIRSIFKCSAVGSADTVRKGLEDFIEQTRPDELMITGNIYDHQARLRSFKIAADILKTL